MRRVARQPVARRQYKGDAPVRRPRTVSLTQRPSLQHGRFDLGDPDRCAAQTARVLVRLRLPLDDTIGDLTVLKIEAPLQCTGLKTGRNHPIHAHRSQGERLGLHAGERIHIDLRGLTPTHHQPEMKSTTGTSQCPHDQAGKARIGDPQFVFEIGAAGGRHEHAADAATVHFVAGGQRDRIQFLALDTCSRQRGADSFKSHLFGALRSQSGMGRTHGHAQHIEIHT